MSEDKTSNEDEAPKKANASGSTTEKPALSDAESQTDTEDPKTLAELASRIVAAQIIAGSQYQTAAAIWQQQKEALQMLVSCLGHLFPNNEPARESIELLLGKLRTTLGPVPYPSSLAPTGLGSTTPESALALKYARDLLAGEPSRIPLRRMKAMTMSMR